MTFIYREHAIKRMFERDIYEEDVEDTVLNGEIIEEYPNDKPYPSFLALKLRNNKPLHVVYAKNMEKNEIIIITAYHPDKSKWSKDFKTRIKI